MSYFDGVGKKLKIKIIKGISYEFAPVSESLTLSSAMLYFIVLIYLMLSSCLMKASRSFVRDFSIDINLKMAQWQQ